MTNWLDKLEELEREATAAPWDEEPWALDYGDFELSRHLRNRSKEIAALVKEVKKLNFSHAYWCVSNIGKACNCENGPVIKALNNLLREET